MKISPEVTVLMPVYNGSRDIKVAIESILNQSFKNFEFLIIDDGSEDNSVEIIENYAAADDRIVLIKNAKNSGIVYSLNVGIALSKGKFIARMDADDISMPDRFEKQINLLSSTNADICGSHWLVMNTNEKIMGINLVPMNKSSLITYLANGIVPFAHGSVIIRKEFLSTNNLIYGPNKFSEDYCLWVKIFKKKGIFVNCNDILYKYRDYETSSSKNKNKEHINRAIEIRKEFIHENQEGVDDAIKIQTQKLSELTYVEKVNLFSLALTKIFTKNSISKIIKLGGKLSIKVISHSLIRAIKR